MPEHVKMLPGAQPEPESLPLMSLLPLLGSRGRFSKVTSLASDGTVVEAVVKREGEIIEDADFTGTPGGPA